MPNRRSFVFALSVLFLGCATTQRIPSSSEPRPQVAIVGGGLAGLVAAYELEKQGVTAQLIEQADHLGGRVSSVTYGPHLVAESGMQELWEQSPLTSVAKELGLSFAGDVPFSSVIMDNQLIPYTQETVAEYFDVLFTAKEREEQRAWMAEAESLFRELEAGTLTPRLKKLEAMSFEEWLSESRVSPKVAEWIRLTLECELGSRSEQFSALFGLAELRMFLFGGEKALHVLGGNSKLISRLEHAIKGPKTLSARVIQIRRGKDAEGKPWVEVSYLKNGRLERLEADRALVTVPWTVLHTLQFDPPLPQEVWSSIESLGRGQYIKVHFLVDRDIDKLWGGSEGNPFPVLTRGPLGVIYGPETADPVEGRRRIFTLLLFAEHAERGAGIPREQLRTELVGALDRLWPGFAKYVEAANFYTYVPAAIPYWPKGRSPFDAQAQLLFSDFGGVYLAGDWLVSSHGEGATRAAMRQATTLARDLKAEDRP